MSFLWTPHLRRQKESDKVPQYPLDDKQEEEEIVVVEVVIKMFTGLKATGLRVYPQPSFTAPSVALINLVILRGSNQTLRIRIILLSKY